MDQTLKAMLRVLEEGKPELKIAATQLLGELRPSDAVVARALADRLSSAESYLTPFVLEALAGIGTSEAVKVLVGKLHLGGTIGDRVAHLLSQMGPEVTKALVPVFDDGDAEMQARVLAILGRHSDREALTILKKAMLHSEPPTSEKAADVLRGHLDDLPDKQRDFLKQGLARTLNAKAAENLQPGALAQGVLVLGELNGADNRSVLLKYATPKNDPVVRQAALQALQDVPLTAAQRRTILSYVFEEDMTHVARPAMRLLAEVDEWSKTAIESLEKLLDSRSEERRLFALRALRHWHSERMAKTCIKTLIHGSPEFQEAALQALGGNPAALDSLLRAFQIEKNIDRGRLLAVPLAKLGAQLSSSQRKSLVEKCSKLLTGGDPLGDVYLDLLLEIDAERGAKDLVDKAVRLRRARRLPECLTILIRLAQTEHLSGEGRYQLAVARLMMDAQEGLSAERKSAGDATMGYFAVLVRDGFALFDRLKKEGQLTPDDLFRVGRHFATGVAQERRFGSDLLHHVADKHARRKVGEEAKLMLRSEGL